MRATPIRRRKVYELVAEQLKDMIETGRFRPGDRLPSERELMVTFNVGRPAVREALQELRNTGLISSSAGRRATVREPDMATILDSISGAVDNLLRKKQSQLHLFQARRFIECAVARHAAQYADKRHVERLKQALDANLAALGDHRRYEESDIAYHRVLFTVPDNPIILASHQAFDHWLIERWHALHRTAEQDRESYDGHRRVFEAILMRDADAAEREMAAHLDASWAVWQSQADA